MTLALDVVALVSSAAHAQEVSTAQALPALLSGLSTSRGGYEWSGDPFSSAASGSIPRIASTSSAVVAIPSSIRPN